MDFSQDLDSFLNNLGSFSLAHKCFDFLFFPSVSAAIFFVLALVQESFAGFLMTHSFLGSFSSFLATLLEISLTKTEILLLLQMVLSSGTSTRESPGVLP